MGDDPCVDQAIDAIERTFYSAEGMAYLGEDVTMIQHQLQAGALAIAAGCSDSLIVAGCSTTSGT